MLSYDFIWTTFLVLCKGKKQHEHSYTFILLCSTEGKKNGFETFIFFYKQLTIVIFCFSISTFSPHSKRWPILISVQDLCNFLDVKLQKQTIRMYDNAPIIWATFIVSLCRILLCQVFALVLSLNTPKGFLLSNGLLQHFPHQIYVINR